MALQVLEFSKPVIAERLIQAFRGLGFRGLGFRV